MTKPLDLTKPIRTRNGTEVRILCTDRVSSPDTSIVALVMRNGTEYVYSYDRFGINMSIHSDYHLVNGPERVVKFANVYRTLVGYQYDTLSSAISNQESGIIGKIRFTYEDGTLVSVALI